MTEMTNPKVSTDTQSSDPLETLFMQALGLQQSGQILAAQALYRKLLTIQPDHFDATHYLGICAAQNGKFEQAIELLGRAVRINNTSAQAFHNLGLAQYDLKQYEDALLSFNNALKLRADYADAYANCGNTYKALNKYSEALEHYARALTFNPELANAYLNCGLILFEIKRFETALNQFQHLLALKPNDAEAHLHYGNTLVSLHRHQEAFQHFDQAIRLNPQFAEAWLNKGNVLKTLKHLDEALNCYKQAIAIHPEFDEAFNNYGLALQEQNRAAAALAYFQRAIALKPEFADSHRNSGLLLADQDQHVAALDHFEQAHAINPHLDYLPGYRLAAKNQLCDWRQRQEDFAKLTASIRNGGKAVAPQILLAISDNPLLQKQVAVRWINDKYPAALTPPPARHPIHDKIRLGYFSADFGPHPVAYLTADLFENHDRNRFELYGFSSGPETQSAIRTRVKNGFDQFIDIRLMSAEAVLKQCRELEIDIAIDLGGHTRGSLNSLFSQRLAPVQVNYLGYPGTIGAGYMDYIIADHTVIPAANSGHFAEKVIRLPNSYMVNAASRPPAEPLLSRSQLGLPENATVFCCFNNSYKITPELFACWLTILSSVDNSVLWLSEDNPVAAANLRGLAQQRGVSSDRLIFASRLPDFKQRLARYTQADLFLDTLPYNAHATAGDALWAGLPVLTSMGESFASRVAASQLQAIGLPELITTSLQDYQQQAIALALQPQKLTELKNRLAANRHTSALFNIHAYRQHIETAFTEMYRRHLEHLPPEEFTVTEAG